MPGISLKCVVTKEQAKAENYASDELFLNALNTILYNDSYKKDILLKEDRYIIACTGYPQYPIRIIENSQFWICLEGKIYDKQRPTQDKEINDLMSRICDTSTIGLEKKIIVDWLLETDGDYVIYALNKKNKDLLIMNDVLGRLPLYYYKDERQLIVSREVQLISCLINANDNNQAKFDNIGIAQFLLFSNTVGKRTLLSNTYRFEPATLLRLHNNDSDLKMDTLFRFNFEYRNDTNDGIKKNAKELVSLFSEACSNRVDHSTKNIIALSGGFDSRAIAASFHRNKIQGYAVTSTEPNWRPTVGSTTEEEIAEQLAKSMDIEWENYGIMKPLAEDMILLLRIKNGLTYLAHSFLIRFLDKLKHKNDCSGITLFTGHGGDAILADSSRGKIISLDHLVGNILRITGRLPLSEVAALVKIKETEIADEIKNVLSSYPEENFDGKLVHYLIYESNYKFSFEIEDINRFYFWSVAPFYSIHFFKYVMNCPDEDKSDLALYREFLFMLSPSAAAIKNSNWGCSIMSKRFRFLQFILSLIWKYPLLKKIVKKIKDKKGYKQNSKIIQCMREQVNNCDNISKYLSQTEIEKIMNNCNNYNYKGIDNLFTITSLIEKTLNNNSTIEKYYDK